MNDGRYHDDSPRPSFKRWQEDLRRRQRDRNRFRATCWLGAAILIGTLLYIGLTSCCCPTSKPEPIRQEDKT